MLATTALACGRPFFFTGHQNICNKETQRKRGNFQNKSKDPTFISEEVSSVSEGNVGTSLQVNSKDIGTSDKIRGAPRSDVLQACTLTSGLLLVGGLVLRQASHFASSNGWPIADPADVSFNFETWHLELVAGLVILISSSRYILLQTWSEFRDSSEAANSQILTYLEPLDYIVVACLPGISEELLFRGALMLFFGIELDKCPYNWCCFWCSSSGQRPEIFICNLGNICWIRLWYSNHSFFKRHSSNGCSLLKNIIGALLWRFTSNSQKDI